MKQVMPMMLVGVLLAGCASDPNTNKPIDPSLVQATVEVKGMS